jgi:hypothetical protein
MTCGRCFEASTKNKKRYAYYKLVVDVLYPFYIFFVFNKIKIECKRGLSGKTIEIEKW